MVTPHLETLCEALAQALTAKHLCMAAAESCTGGLIAASCTQLSGSSVWFERGFVTYSNAAKTELLDVPASLIETHGAVSEEVAKAMAVGALAHSNAHFSVAVTGIAGLTLSITRGYNGTTAVAHAAGAVVRHVITAQDMTDAQNHYSATTSVHGIADTANLATLTNLSDTLTNAFLTMGA
jgi:PncC family amidohydrolase